MNISPVRYYKDGSGWDLATLSNDETNKLHEEVRFRNRHLLKECRRRRRHSR